MMKILYHALKVYIIICIKKSIFIIDIFMPTHELTSNLNTQKIDLMDFKDSTQKIKF